MSGGGGGGGESEASDTLQREKDMETSCTQLHEEIKLLEIMSARTCLDLLNLAMMGNTVRMTLQDSGDEVTAAGLQSLGVEIEKAKATMRELRSEILKAKRERIEVIDGLDGFTESGPAVHKQKGSHSTEKRPNMFTGVIFGIAALVMALSFLGIRDRGYNNRM